MQRVSLDAGGGELVSLFYTPRHSKLSCTVNVELPGRQHWTILRLWNSGPLSWAARCKALSRSLSLNFTNIVKLSAGNGAFDKMTRIGL